MCHIDTWTIYASICTGILIGFIIIFGGLALLIHSEVREARRKKREETEQTLAESQDQSIALAPPATQ